MPLCGVSAVGHSPSPYRLSLSQAAGDRCPISVGAGSVVVGTRHKPPSARSCELALCAVGAAQGHPGGAPCASVRGVWGWAHSPPATACP